MDSSDNDTADLGASVSEARLWLALVREARMLKGSVAAAKLWSVSPLPPLVVAVAMDGSAFEGFLEDVCEITGKIDDFIYSTDLAGEFNLWRKEKGFHPVSVSAVGREIARLDRQSRGAWAHRRNDGRGVCGVKWRIDH